MKSRNILGLLLVAATLVACDINNNGKTSMAEDAVEIEQAIVEEPTSPAAGAEIISPSARSAIESLEEAVDTTKE